MIIATMQQHNRVTNNDTCCYCDNTHDNGEHTLPERINILGLYYDYVIVLTKSCVKCY